MPAHGAAGCQQPPGSAQLSGFAHVRGDIRRAGAGAGELVVLDATRCRSVTVLQMLDLRTTPLSPVLEEPELVQ